MTLTQEEQDLLRLIESSFASDALPPSDVVQCGCDECRDLAHSFGGREWTEVPDETIEFEFGSLPLFSEEAFCYYLPAYLHRSVRDSDGVTSVPEFLFYSLTPDEFTLPRFAGLSPPQVLAVYRFLDYYLGQLIDDPEVRETVEYWQSLAEQS